MSGKKVVVSILCGVGALAVVLGACNYKQIANSFRKMTSSPEEYFRYVEEQAAEETFSTFANYYELAKDAYNLKEDKASESKLTVLFEEGAKEFFEEVAEVDVSKLSELGLSLDAIVNNGAKTGEVAATFYLNGKDSVSGSLWYDLKEEAVFAKLPELSEQLLAMDLETFIGYDSEEAEEILEQFEAVYEQLPEKKQLAGMFKRYLSAGISCIDQVEEEKDSLSAEGISKNYTKLTTVLDGNDVYDILEAIAEEMRKDEELEELIINITDALEEEDGDDVYEEFCEGLEKFLEDCEDVKDFDGEIEVSVWVDNTGAVVGRYLEVEDEAEFFYAMPKNGSKFGYEASIEIEGTEISFKGEGKERGNKLSGEFQFKLLGDRVLAFEVEELNTKTWKEGSANGTITVRPLGDLEDALEEIEDETEYKIKNPALVFSMDAKKNTSSMEIVNNEEAILKVIWEEKEAKAKEVSLPEDEEALEIRDEDMLLQWLTDSNLKDVLEGLEEEGIPSEWLEEFDDMFDYMEYEAAMTLLEEGEYQKAKEAFFALGDYDDAEDFVFYCEAKLQCEAGNYEKALEAYDEIDGYFWYDYYFEDDCSYQYAESLLEAGDYEKAVDLFIEYLFYDEYYYALALQMMEEGEYEEAEWMLSEITDYAPADEAYKECSYQLGQEAMNRGDYSLARSYFYNAKDYLDAEEKLTELDRELELLQMPEHQIYTMRYKEYAAGVTLPESYLGIPMEKVTDAEVEEYLYADLYGAFSAASALTDEYVAKFTEGEYTTVDAYMAYIREQCEEEKYALALGDYLYENSSVAALDEEMIQTRAKIERFRILLTMQGYGLDMEDFLDSAGYADEEALMADLVQEIRKLEHVYTVCYAIAQKEGLTVTEEDYDYYVTDFAEEFGVSEEDFLMVNDKAVLDEVFLVEKALNFLIDHANIQ